jgi:branched-chain amino acid transport system ATP-binding protein
VTVQNADAVAIPEQRAAVGEPMLALDGIEVYYGNIAAVKGLSITVMPGEIVTLLGSNGAGKSTTLRTISGLLHPRRGTITFEGRRLDAYRRGKRRRWSPTQAHQIVRRGIAHAPEGRRIFPQMSVDENLDLGAFVRTDREQIAADKESVYELFPRLRERMTQYAGTLSGGEQQMLAVGRALMARPKLLLLDEPSMGLAPVLVDVIFETITRIRSQGTTVLLVEQNALAALEIADRAYVLESGRLKLSGAAADLVNDPEVVQAYLGG